MSIDIGDFGLSRKKMSDEPSEKSNIENNENTDNKSDKVSKLLFF